VLDEQGRELPQGEVGELAGRGQVMMKGYYKQADKTRDLFWHDKDGRLFFKSGRHGAESTRTASSSCSIARRT